MTLETNKDYQKVLLEVTRYLPTPLGFTKYEGDSKSDKTYPRILNTIIGLIITILQKIDKKFEETVEKLENLENEVSEIKRNINNNLGQLEKKVIDFDIEEQFAKLSLGDIVPKRTTKVNKWRFY